MSKVNESDHKSMDKSHLKMDHDTSKQAVRSHYIFETNTYEQSRLFPGEIHIEPVMNRKDFTLFYQVPFQVYHQDPYWVAPFWREYKDFFNTKNPFWLHATSSLFLAKKNNVVIGRIAAIIDDAFCQMTGEKIGYFGFFECMDDYECAHALFSTSQEWLVKKDMKVMRGPIDGRVDVGCGFLLSGFNVRPSILSTYKPPYYLSFAEKFGMKKSRDLLLYHFDLTQPIPINLQKKAEECKASGIHIRPFRRLRTRKELQWWVKLFLQTFSDHWGYVPVPEEEVTTRFGVKQLRWFVDPRLFLIAEYQGTPVAYLWSTPDYNQLFQKMNGRLGPLQALRFLLTQGKITTGKLHFIGIKKELRHNMIGSLLNYEVFTEMKRRGYSGAEIGWIDENNEAAHKTMAVTGATVSKIYRVFEKNITRKELNIIE